MLDVQPAGTCASQSFATSNTPGIAGNSLELSTAGLQAQFTVTVSLDRQLYPDIERCPEDFVDPSLHVWVLLFLSLFSSSACDPTFSMQARDLYGNLRCRGGDDFKVPTCFIELISSLC